MTIALNGVVTTSVNSTASSGTSLSTTINTPANANGDLTGLMVLVVLAFGGANSPGINTPAGWTLVYSTASSSSLGQAACFTKVPSGTEPASFSISTSNVTSQTRSIGAICYLLDGVDSVAPVTDHVQSNSATSGGTRNTGTVTAPALETADCTLYAFAASTVTSSTMSSTPSGSTSDTNALHSATGPGMQFAAFHKIQAASGNFNGAGSWTTSALGIETAVLLKAATSSVQITRTLLWNVLTRVGLITRTLLWNVNVLVNINRTLKWNTNSRVTKTPTLLWNVLARLTKTVTLRWKDQPSWAKIPNSAEIWTPVSDNSDTWTPIPDNNSTWTPGT